MLGSTEVSGMKNSNPTENFSVEVHEGLCRTNVVPFWVSVGSMLGHLGQACAMLGLHWAMPGLFCFVLTKMVSRMVPNALRVDGSDS